MKPRIWGALTTIRVRLGAAIAIALLPVLLLGAGQAGLAYQKYAQEQRFNLTLAAERSAATARARMEAAGVLLQTLTPAAIGYQCSQGLNEVVQDFPGYDNLARFNAIGRIACATANVSADPDRRNSAWFARLKAGEHKVVLRAPASLSARPALLAAQRAQDAQGRFDGALVAVIDLDSLRPNLDDPSLPNRTQVALVDRQGHFLSPVEAKAFGPTPPDFVQHVRAQGSMLYSGLDGAGARRVFTAAPLVGDVFVILSAPAPGVFSWARLNPLSSLMFPILSFLVAFVAVWVVAERVVVRWLHYLSRVAALYARGRFTVKPVRAQAAPLEIRELAGALEAMAGAIVARDQSLRESLAQKDALMREIHHRVKNNLQVITSLLNLQQRALQDPAARGAMSDTRQRVNAIALIYRALYEGPDLKRVDLRQFLGDLIGQLVGESDGAAIRTDLEADELIVDPNQLAPLALFAVEAITNAQKHALALSGGSLHVRFSVRGEEAELSVADEGSGRAPELNGTGVGRVLMSAFARQLRGKMDLSLNDVGGVTARLVFPTPSATQPETPPVERNRLSAKAL
ncbi:MAG TPA: sensor histidine kinase [Caulobacteraceae bacterium]|jgi:two-component sensor histidine kinase|nr:sensor histidine kinase [Caulobacteraceae bacterium]